MPALPATPIAPRYPIGPKHSLEAGGGRWTYSRAMPEWIGIAAKVVTGLLAITALIVSIWASRRVARAWEIQLLLARFDLEAAKREAARCEQRLEREAAKQEAEARASA